jgi:hypothetical protein
MTQETKWREKYYEEVEMMTRRYEEINASMPTIIRKVTDREIKEWSKPKSTYWTLTK